jgi:hypothetical protein
MIMHKSGTGKTVFLILLILSAAVIFMMNRWISSEVDGIEQEYESVPAAAHQAEKTPVKAMKRAPLTVTINTVNDPLAPRVETKVRAVPESTTLSPEVQQKNSGSRADDSPFLVQ